MKLVINYDLINKVKQANGKFVLPETIISSAETSIMLSSLSIPVIVVMGYSGSEFVSVLLQQIERIFLIGCGADYLSHCFFRNNYRQSAIEDLKHLSSQLAVQDIDTNWELLLKARKYYVEYDWTLADEKKTRPIQKKYILFPIDINGDKVETSILQEHELGSKDYVLSFGSPSRVFKPAFNQI